VRGGGSVVSSLAGNHDRAGEATAIGERSRYVLTCGANAAVRGREGGAGR
jgi:hypothetical protein